MGDQDDQPAINETTSDPCASDGLGVGGEADSVLELFKSSELRANIRAYIQRHTSMHAFKCSHIASLVVRVCDDIEIPACVATHHVY